MGEEQKTPMVNPKEGEGAGKAERKPGKPNRRGYGFKRDVRSKMNDVSWYVIDPQIMRDVASLSFSNMLGLPVRLGGVPAQSIVSQLMTVNYVPTIGYSADPTSGYNLAIRNLYTVVRHKNSGHTNYESPDLGFYLFATTEVVAALLECERALSLVNSYLIKNRNIPARILAALGFDAQDIAAHSAQYRGRLNVLLSRVSSLCIPKDYKYFQRRIWMASNIFKDHKSTKGIAICFKSQGIWRFRAEVLTTGGALSFRRWANLDSDSLAARLDWIEESLNAITEDEDMNIMSGDILKAFGAENCQKYGFIPENTQLFPEFVEEMLPQIHNMVTLPSYKGVHSKVMFSGELATADDAQAIINSADDAWIIQRDGYAVFTPVAGDVKAVSLQNDKVVRAGFAETLTNNLVPTVTSRLILNSFEETPTPEFVMLATRLRSVYDFFHLREEVGDDVLNYMMCELSSFGSEIVENFSVGILTETGTGYSLNTYSSIGIINTTQWASTDVLHRLIQYGAQIAQIDWAPITYNFVVDETRDVVVDHTFFGDLDNYTLLDADVLTRMHETAVQAEFTTPVIAEFRPK